MKKYAAVDVGTNSCRLLIAEIDSGNGLIRLYKALESTRVGQGVSKSGLITAEAMDRTLLCLGRFREKMRELGVEKYRAIATSAVREAANGIEFVRRAKDESQIDVDIIDGEEEAALSYQGVIRGLSLPRSPLVVDLGGGSTEFMCPEENLQLSIPLGAVRATEDDMYAGLIKDKLAPLADIKERFKDRPLVLVGGTASTLVAVKLSLDPYDSDVVHGKILTRSEVADIYNLLARMPLPLLKRLPGVQAERADIITKGALIMLMIVDALNKAEVVVSESELLQGIIWSLIE